MGKKIKRRQDYWDDPKALASQPVVEAHHGTVEADSTSGFTAFTIRVPYGDPARHCRTTRPGNTTASGFSARQRGHELDRERDGSSHQQRTGNPLQPPVPRQCDPALGRAEQHGQDGFGPDQQPVEAEQERPAVHGAVVPGRDQERSAYAEPEQPWVRAEQVDDHALAERLRTCATPGRRQFSLTRLPYRGRPEGEDYGRSQHADGGQDPPGNGAEDGESQDDDRQVGDQG